MKIAHCNVCGWRLFDAEWNGNLIIHIKCPRCKQIITYSKKAS